MELSQLILKYPWLVVLGFIPIYVLVRVIAKRARQDRDRYVPDRTLDEDAPDPAPMYRKARIQMILALVAIVAFTVIGLINTFRDG